MACAMLCDERGEYLAYLPVEVVDGLVVVEQGAGGVGLAAGEGKDGRL